MSITRRLFLLALWGGVGSVVPAAAQSVRPAGPLAPPGYGSLAQSDLSLRLRNEDIEVRFVPLDPRVTRLLARDAYQSVEGLVLARRRSIDSIATLGGVSRPGLALVTFFGLRPNAAFDPQTLSVLVRNRLFRPLGIVPLSVRFSSQQLEVREQVSAIYVYEQELPVEDAFALSYDGLNSEDWLNKQSLLDRERARVASRARAGHSPDSLRGVTR
ncbi:MAG: hypothetical protein H0T90_00970 [Gemmatimonadales bacterium]|nr:hypothetical protein [Gemmatimonadales bacterium]